MNPDYAPVSPQLLPIETQVVKVKTDNLLRREATITIKDPSNPNVAKTIRVRIYSERELSSSEFQTKVQQKAKIINDLVKEIGLGGGKFKTLNFEFLETGEIESIKYTKLGHTLHDSLPIAGKVKELVDAHNRQVKINPDSNASAALGGSDPSKEPLVIHKSTIDAEALRDQEKDLRNLNKELKLELTDEKIKQIALTILTEKNSWYKTAGHKGSGGALSIKENGIEFVVTKEQNIYVRLSVEGKGNYNVVSRIVLVRGPAFRHLDQTGRALQALRETQAKAPTTAPPQTKTAAPKPGEKPLSPEEKAAKEKIDAANKARREELEKAEKENEEKITARISSSNSSRSHLSFGHKIKERNGSVATIADFCNGGDANKLMARGTATPRDSAVICRDACKGVAQLHRMGIVHRDLKPDNLLLTVEQREVKPGDKDYPPNADGKTPVTVTHVVEAKVSDFGKSSVMEGEVFQCPDLPVMWMSPETFAGEGHYTTALDVYQLGRTAYMLFAGISMADQIPFSVSPLMAKAFAKAGEYNEEFYTLMKDSVIEQIGKPETWPNWGKLPPNAQVFIKSMLDIDPNKRPTIEDSIKFFEKLARSS